MKRLQYLTVLLILLTIMSGGYAAQKIYLTSGEWPPYFSENLNENGFLSAVVREAFRAENIDVEYGYFPWKRAYLYAERALTIEGNTWLGSPGWLYTDQRAENFFYSDVILTEAEVLYSIKSNPVYWQTVEDLAGLTIGGTAHTRYEIFEEAERRNILTIDRAGGYDILFSRLLAQRVDAIPSVKGVADFYIENQLTKEQREQIIYAPQPVGTKVYYLMLSKQKPANAQLITAFNRGLNKIKQNGVYDGLIEKLQTGYFYK
jgi:polar amino acid transport system substrate-binding protein